MKNFLVYGFGIALGNLLLTFSLYFLGYHSDPAKVGTAQLVATIGSLAIFVIGIVLGTKAEREQRGLESEFGYGKAFACGFFITLFAAIFGVLGYDLYILVINPGFNDVIMQSQVAKMEAAGRSSEQVEQMQAVSRKFMSPTVQSVFALIGSIIFGSIISSITSALLKRESVEKFESA